MHTDKRLVMSCSLLVWLALSCGDNGDGDGSAGAGTSGGGTSATGGASASGDGGGGASATGGISASGRGGGGGSATSGQGGGGEAAAGAGGTAGNQEPTPPPEMPRELGPPDGIYCESTIDPPAETCSAGSRCCPNGLGGTIDQVCVDGPQCPPCVGTSCGELVCDGPEDCAGGAFCCAATSSCARNPDTCVPAGNENPEWRSTECRMRCVGDRRDPDHGTVVCKDDRDCPGPYVAGRCQPLDASGIPFGLKACSN